MPNCAVKWKFEATFSGQWSRVKLHENLCSSQFRFKGQRRRRRRHREENNSRRLRRKKLSNELIKKIWNLIISLISLAAMEFENAFECNKNKRRLAIWECKLAGIWLIYCTYQFLFSFCYFFFQKRPSSCSCLLQTQCLM